MWEVKQQILNLIVSPSLSPSPSPSPSAHSGRKLEDTVFDRDVEKAFMKASESTFHKKVVPTLVVAKEVGNMYTASLYGGFASLLTQ